MKQQLHLINNDLNNLLVVSIKKSHLNGLYELAKLIRINTEILWKLWACKIALSESN